MKPGEFIIDDGDIELNQGQKGISLVVNNKADRPIQVGSHYHFFETNIALIFERELAYGRRLNIAAGTAIRFEPGQEREVELIDFGGDRIVYGFCGLVSGQLIEQ